MVITNVGFTGFSHSYVIIELSTQSHSAECYSNKSKSNLK